MKRICTLFIFNVLVNLLVLMLSATAFAAGATYRINRTFGDRMGPNPVVIDTDGFVNCPTNVPGPAPATALSTGTAITCEADRNILGDEAYARFCSCIRDTTANGTGVYRKISAPRFTHLEEHAMKAAVAMKMNSLRGPLRNVARGLTYAAFNLELRPTVARVQTADGGEISTPPDREGLACLPGNMGAYIDRLKASGTSCKDAAIKKLTNGMTLVQDGKTRQALRINSGLTRESNFGNILDVAYTRIFSEGLGIPREDAMSLGTGFIQDARLLEAVSFDDTGMSAPAPSEPAPSEPASEEATPTISATNIEDTSLADILFQALTNMQAGHAAIIDPEHYPKFKLNGLIAPLVMDQRERVKPQKLKEFLETFHQFVKSAHNGEVPNKTAFSATFKNFLKEKLQTALSDCEEKILKPLKDEICPLLDEDKFSITKLLGPLDSPRERQEFATLMNRVGRSSGGAAEGSAAQLQTDQLLCYSYADPQNAMNSIFNYTNAVPVSAESVVFSIPERLPDEHDYNTVDDENAAEQALVNDQRTQGDAIRNGQIGGQITINLTKTQEITRQYRGGSQGNGSQVAKNPNQGGKGPSDAASEPAYTAPANTSSPTANGDGTFRNPYGNTTTLGAGTGLIPGGGTSAADDEADTDAGAGNQQAPGDAGTVDYAARIADLQRMIEDREAKLREAISRQGQVVGDSMVSAARDRDAEVSGLKDEIKRLRDDLTAARTQAAANGVTIPAAPATPMVANAAPASGSAAPKGAPVAAAPVGGGVGPSRPADLGAAGLITGSSGDTLSGYDLYSSLGFISNVNGMALTLNGKSFAPNATQFIIPRAEFDGANNVKRQQIYTLANGAPIYVVNDDNTVTVYIAQTSADGVLAYVPEGSSAPAAAPVKKGRAIASEGEPEVAPESRTRVQDLHNLMNGE